MTARARLLTILVAALFVGADLMVEACVDMRKVDALRVSGRRDNAIVMEAQALLGVVQAFESGQRAYLLVARPEYLESSDETLRLAREHLAKLRELAAGDPETTARIDVSSSLVDTKIEEMTQAVGLVRADRREAALELVKGGAGRDLMARLRTELKDLMQPSSARLMSVRDQIDRLLERTLVGTMAKTSLLMALVVALYVVARRA